MTDTIKISLELAKTIEMTWRVHDKHSAPTSERGAEAIRNGLRELRQLLATPPADAADMGGQAGEDGERNRAFKACPNSGCDWGAFYLGWKAKAKDLVSIRAALESQHRQRAVKLVEALRDLTGECCEHYDIDDPSTNPGIKCYIENAREALADWEKTSCGK